MERAIFHGELAHRFKPSSILANNLGYLHMKSDNLERAKVMLEIAASIVDEKSDNTALIRYNLGIVNLKQMKVGEALNQFRAADAAKEMEVACALVPIVDANTEKLTFKEVESPNIKETIKKTIEIVNEFSANL